MRSQRVGRVLVVTGASLVIVTVLTLVLPVPSSGEGGEAAAVGVPSAHDFDGASPVALTIDAIGVHTSIGPVALQADGKVGVPKAYEQVGWYAPGPPPGERGAAVLLGHVDSRTGPAVFYRLRDLQPGDGLEVRRADGLAVRFVVDRLGQYDRRRFPTATVYGPVDGSELRLVTCAGPYKGHYRDNLVVFAHRVS